MTYLTILKILAPIVLALVAFYLGVVDGKASTNAKWQKKWDDQQQTIIQANLNFEKQQRDKENEWGNKLNEANSEAQKLREQLSVDVSNGVAVDDRLREQYKELSLRLKRCGNSIPPNGSQSADQAADMFPQLLARCDARTREIAEYADELEIAHAVCLKSYAAIKNKEAVK